MTSAENELRIKDIEAILHEGYDLAREHAPKPLHTILDRLEDDHVRARRTAERAWWLLGGDSHDSQTWSDAYLANDSHSRKVHPFRAIDGGKR